jgi:peptide/histidine transporter 3/4
LRETKYFESINKNPGNILTITGCGPNIVGSGRATIILPMGTTLINNEALLYPKSTRTLLSFKDIRANGFHIETDDDDNGKEYLIITKRDENGKHVVERLPSFATGLYYTKIVAPPVYTTLKTVFRSSELFCLWHDRLGHPGLRMMRNIINNSNGHNVNVKNFPNPDDFVCSACATGKLIIRPSPLKVKDEIPAFLQRIQGDICGPIQPLSGPFRYFMVLIDDSSKWSNVCLLSTRNHAFAKLISQIIQYGINSLIIVLSIFEWTTLDNLVQKCSMIIAWQRESKLSTLYRMSTHKMGLRRH